MFRIAFFLSLLLLLSPLCARADTYSHAVALLESAKQATGGLAWDKVESIRVVYTSVFDEMVTERGTELRELPSGRYIAEVASTNGLPLRFGWDGQRNW